MPTPISKTLKTTERTDGNTKKHATGGCLISGLIVEKQDINLKAPGSVPVLLGHNRENPVGVATINRKGSVLVADLDIYQEKGIEKLYPSVGYRVNKATTKDGETRVDEGIIYAIGLSVKTNVDSSIKTIGEQLNKKE